MKRRIVTLLLVVLLITQLPLFALAVQESNMMQSVWIEDTKMTILSADVDGSEGKYTAMLDGQNIPLQSSKLPSENIPVTIFCVVDVSGSITQYQTKLLRDTLLTISNSMGEQDTMVIATVDNQLEIGEELCAPADRETAIQNIQPRYEDTNLYSGIVKSLEWLKSSTSYNPYRCMVVISDGIDCQDNGMTEQEVLAAIEDSRLPLYTVALLRDYAPLEGGKLLGSFARSSYGGIHQTTISEGASNGNRTDVTGEEFGSNIWNAVQNTSVLHADLSGVGVDPNRIEAKLVLEFAAGDNTYTDSIVLDADLLPKVVAETETVPATSDPNPEPDPIPGKRSIIWIVAAVAAVVLIVICVVVCKKSSKKEAEDVADNPDGSNTDADIGETTIDLDPDSEDPDYHPEKTYRVYMTDIPYGHHHLTYLIPAYCAVTFGRSNRAQNIIDSEDNRLSGCHFSLIAQDGLYCVRDEDSKNGTFVNGISIVGKDWSKLQSGDKIRAGGYEYRIIIEPAEND